MNFMNPELRTTMHYNGYTWTHEADALGFAVIALELAEGPLFIAYPVDVESSDLREGMTLELRWIDATDKFGEYNLPVFGPSAARS